jgi:hypothetical protein
MSTHARKEEETATDEQLQRELQLLIQRHAEFSRRLESILTEMQGNPSTAVAPGSSALPAAVPANISKELARLNDRISHMEEQFDSLWRQLGVNSARIQEILDSRTWKIFTGMGGVVLKLVGRR